MSLRLFTTIEKLGLIEALIQDFRYGAQNPSSENRLAVLKSIASDLRGRLEGAPSVALVDLEARVVAAVRSKTASGYSSHTLRGAGEGLMARWPTIKQALEKFGEDV
jgi:hypothetical protein